MPAKSFAGRSGLPDEQAGLRRLSAASVLYKGSALSTFLMSLIRLPNGRWRVFDVDGNHLRLVAGNYCGANGTSNRMRHHWHIFNYLPGPAPVDGARHRERSESAARGCYVNRRSTATLSGRIIRRHLIDVWNVPTGIDVYAREFPEFAG